MRLLGRKGNRRRAGRRPRREGGRLGGRAGRGLLVLLAIALGAGGLPLVGYMGYRQVISSGFFDAKDIQVTGLERLERGAVIEASGLQAADAPPLLDLDEGALRERLEAHPWIASATARIELPNTVHLEITERRLLGLAYDGRFYLVDEEGAVIKPLTSDDAVITRPVVSGFGGRLAQGDEGAQAAAVEAFEVARRYEGLGLGRWATLSEVSHDPQLGYTLFVERGRGVEVRLGADRLDERLRRLWQVFTLLDERELEVEYVLLDQSADLDEVVIKPVPRVVEAPLAADEALTGAATEAAAAPRARRR